MKTWRWIFLIRLTCISIKERWVEFWDEATFHSRLEFNSENFWPCLVVRVVHDKSIVLGVIYPQYLYYGSWCFGLWSSRFRFLSSFSLSSPSTSSLLCLHIRWPDKTKHQRVFLSLSLFLSELSYSNVNWNSYIHKFLCWDKVELNDAHENIKF